MAREIKPEHKWIQDAVDAAKQYDWFQLVGESVVVDELNDWHEDGLFKNLRQVKDRLCQYCDMQLTKMGQANFNCTLP